MKILCVLKATDRIMALVMTVIQGVFFVYDRLIP
jgi:hypothetical protein